MLEILEKNKEFKELKEIFGEYLNIKEIENLYLYYKIPHKKFLKILKNSQIKKVSIDYNTYGEFMFINFIFKGHYYHSYGLGLHEYRNRIIFDWEIWENFYSEKIEKIPNIPYEKVLEKIEKRIKDLEKIKLLEDNESNLMYNLLADLVDEDSALVELEDLGLI